MLDEEDTPPAVEHEDEVQEARVARTRSGSDHHNTLTPHWDFAFSV
jgi:hypothetical protein